MDKWNSNSVKKAIESVSECSIMTTIPPEDYVTESFWIWVTGTDQRLWVRGFRTDHAQIAGDNPEIEMIEVTTGYSDGDMPNDPILCVVHARVKAALMALGYSVVNSLDPYF